MTFGKGDTSSKGLDHHWAPSPRPGPALTPSTHLMRLAGESRSVAETWPTRVPGALFSGTTRW